jgi:hypothetical protein
MPIHPTFNFIPCSRPKSRHASPNHHRPTAMLHGLMDMLRSNAFSISNPTLWPTIWVKPIYLCLLTENHAFQSSVVLFSYFWANLMHARTRLRLINSFLCYTCAPNLASLKTRLIVLSDNNLFVSDWSCFVVPNVVPSQPSVTTMYYDEIQLQLYSSFYN